MFCARALYVLQCVLLEDAFCVLLFFLLFFNISYLSQFPHKDSSFVFYVTVIKCQV